MHQEPVPTTVPFTVVDTQGQATGTARPLCLSLRHVASRAHKAPAHAPTSRSMRVCVLRWSSPQLSGDLLKQATSDSAEDAQLLQVEEDTGSEHARVAHAVSSREGAAYTTGLQLRRWCPASPKGRCCLVSSWRATACEHPGRRRLPLTFYVLAGFARLHSIGVQSSQLSPPPRGSAQFPCDDGECLLAGCPGKATRIPFRRGTCVKPRDGKILSPIAAPCLAMSVLMELVDC